MPKDVQYRDLPGGPIELQFSDELSHWSLCGPCGMLSREMYKDPLGHIFCRACVDSQSLRKRIFCKHENKDVQFDDLFDAIDVVRLTQEMSVYCPNKKLGCTEHRHLSDIEAHYVECSKAPETTCIACNATFPMKDLRDHEARCPEKRIQCGVCVQGIPRRQYKDHQRQCKPEKAQGFLGPELSNQQPTKKKSEKISTHSSYSSMPPSIMGAEAAPIDNQGPPSLKSDTNEGTIIPCEFCNKSVKLGNYGKHLTVCLQVDEICCHCEKRTTRENHRVHERDCERNPANIKQEPPPSLQEQASLPTRTYASVCSPSSVKQGTMTSDNPEKRKTWETTPKNSSPPPQPQRTYAGPLSGGPSSKPPDMDGSSRTSPRSSARHEQTSAVIGQQPKSGTDWQAPVDPPCWKQGVVEEEAPDRNGVDRGKSGRAYFMLDDAVDAQHWQDGGSWVGWAWNSLLYSFQIPPRFV